MKGFYVVLLVLVAGAVPSYSYSYLALQWPMSYCINLERNFDGACIRPVPGHFTVHGLWPQRGSGGSIDCRFVRGSYPRLYYPNLVRGIDVSILGQYWPDLEGNNQLFWERQYNKHGSCTFHGQNNNQIGYFHRTLALARPLINRMSGLVRTGTFVGGPHRPIDIINDIQFVTGQRPSLKCIRFGNQDLLLEIRFCVAGPGNCPTYTACRGSVFIPRPPMHPFHGL